MKKLLQRIIKRDESGASAFITILLLMPVICGVFGLGVDVSYANYMQTTLQGELDNATVTTAQNQAIGRSLKTGTTSNGRTHLPFDSTLSTIQKKTKNTYINSTAQYGNLNASDRKITTTVSKVVNGDKSKRDTTYIIKSHVTETSNTFFLRMVGVDKATYGMDSTARMGYDTE